MMGNTEGKRRKGCQRIRWSDSITDSMNMNLSKLWKIMENRGSWYATVLEVTKSWTWLSNWTASCHYITGCRPSKNVHVFVVQSLSHVQLFVTPWTATRQVSLSFTTSWSLLKLMSTESVMSSNHLILCHPLLFLPSIFPSIRDFSNESALPIRWPKYRSFNFDISPFNEHPGLISFRMDWLNLLIVQGTLKSLLQHHSSKA